MSTAEIPQLDVDRATSIIAEAKNYKMYDEPMPEDPGDRIQLAAKLVQMARDAKKVIDEDPAKGGNLNAIMAILYQAEVEGGTSTGAQVIPEGLDDNTKIACRVMGTEVEWTWAQIKIHVLDNNNDNLEPVESTQWLRAALDRERAARSGQAAPPAPAPPAAPEAPAASNGSAEVQYVVNEQVDPSAEERWVDNEGIVVVIESIVDGDTLAAREEASGEEVILERSDLKGRLDEVKPEPPPAPEPPAVPEPPAAPAPAAPSAPVDYESLDTIDLKKLVDARGVEVPGVRRTRKKMIEALQADDEAKAQAVTPPAAPEPPAPTPPAVDAQERLEDAKQRLQADTGIEEDDDEQYQVLRRQAYNDFVAEKGIPIPPEYEGDPPELPLDITSVSDADVRRLMGQFQAVTARTKFKWALEHSYERACKRVADGYVRQFMSNNTAGTVAELKAQAEAQEDVVKWRRREQRHHDRAFAFRQLMEIHAEDRDVCSREISGRELEIKRG